MVLFNYVYLIIYRFSEEMDEVESKVMINDTMITKHSIESDDEQNVDHLSPQTLLETPTDNEVQYSLRSPEGTKYS